MKTIPKIKIIVLLLITILLLIQVNAFTTNGTKQTFDFTITSGKNNELSGTDFKSFLVIGDIATVSNSSNFRTEMGFIRTTGYVIGEACEISISCVSGACCSGVCASSCPEEAAAAAAASSIVSAGGSSSVPTSISSSDYVHFYTSIAADEETVLNINREILSVTTITFELNQDLKDVTFSVKLVQNPEHDIKDAHQYFEIEDDKINDENLKYAIIQFKVRKDSGIIKGTVSLNKYNNKWNKLPTEFINEDAEFYYYESSMQSFSLFAITGTKLVEAGIGAGKIEEVIEIPEEEIET